MAFLKKGKFLTFNLQKFSKLKGDTGIVTLKLKEIYSYQKNNETINYQISPSKSENFLHDPSNFEVQSETILSNQQSHPRTHQIHTIPQFFVFSVQQKNSNKIKK